MQALGYYRQIYVPSIDRFCLLETMNVNEAEVQDFLLYRFNSTLENCVSNCFSYFILDICDVFSFNTKKRICSRYRSLKNLTFFNTESVDDSEFYTLVNCTEAGNAVDSFINEETEIETDFNKTKVIPLKFLREVCTIERFPFADSIKAIRITLMYPRTMEMCLAQCRMSFSTVACNAFLFSLAEESCVLLHYNDVPKTQNKIRKSSSHFYKILNCDYDENDSGTELADALISFPSPHSSDSQSSSLEFEELQQSEEVAINSMNLNLVQSPEAPSISSYVNTKVETVKLYAFYEICEIEKANFKTLQGVYSIDINHRIYSLNKCLHLCRREATTINGLPQNFVTVKDGEELVFMIACYNDRIEERLNNPPPMNYYLEEMKKICVVEAYTLQNLSAWAVIANITDVSNIKEGSYIKWLKMSVSYTFGVFSLIMLKQALMLPVQFYIPKLDKICEVESQNLNVELIQNHKVFHFNSTFEHCIGIVFATVYTSRYNIFSYNKEINTCAGYRLHSHQFNTSISTLENEVSVVYALIKCLEVTSDSQFEDINGEEENVDRFLNINIVPVHEKCTAVRLPFSENFQGERYSLTFPNSFTMCFAYCRAFSKNEHCNAVLYSSKENSCLLMRLRNTFSNNSKIMKSAAQLYFLINCEYDTTPVTTDFESFHLVATNETNVYMVTVEHSNMQCEIIKLPLLPTHKNNRVALWAAGTFETCIWFCSPVDEIENICNTVYYSAEEESCLNLNLSEEDLSSNISTNASTSPFMFYIKDCEIGSEIGDREEQEIDDEFDFDFDESSSSSSSENYMVDELPDDLSMYRDLSQDIRMFGEEGVETVYLELVNLHTYYEVCIVQRMNISLLNNAYATNISRPVRFLNECLHFCRATTTNHGCRGVSFLRAERNCQMLFPGSSQLPVSPRAETVRLLGCLKDRENERRGNPDALMYFLEELMLACLIEPYKNTSLNYWKQIGSISHVESFQQCLLICVKAEIPPKCNAVNYSESKDCVLLDRGMHADNYIALPKSVFAAVLFCEPGSIVDLIYSP
ncbi:Isoleucine--tRNA ligase [Trichinella spiralis]|uniref:Isoleucine--tRNA ligase n=1 Tax=Trichinella spiralis TaxID=6334 RepID=A0ABR3KHD9_TRISP